MVNCFLGLFCGVILSQELPPIVNYSTDDYGAGNQNWSISQGQNNYIYVANHQGLLEFNGAQWTLYPSPNQTILRSVKAVGERIYTGCYMQFGYWEYDSKGLLNYTNLSSELNLDIIEDEQFWNIISIDEFVAFQSLNNIYIYSSSNRSVKTISTANTLTKAFLLDKTIYFQEISKGLFRIVDGNPKLVTDHPIMKSSEVVNVSGTTDKLTIATQKNGFFSLTKSGLEPMNFEFPNESILNDLTIYDSSVLKNGDIALGTVGNGLLILNPSGRLVESINLNDGLSNNTVLSIFEDAQSNLWLGLDNGIDCVKLSSPLRKYQDLDGRLGTVYAAVLHDNNLYLGTNQGLFYKSYGSDTEFRLMEGTSGQVWCLKVLNNTLFAGHNVGTFQVEAERAELISGIPGTWDIQEIDGKENLLLQGNFSGLHILEKSDGNDRWTYRNKIEGFDNSSRYFAQLDSMVFVSHEYKGVYHIKVDLDYRKASQIKNLEEVEKGKNAALQTFNDQILYASPEGVFVFDANKKAFYRDDTYSQLLKKETYTSGKLFRDNFANRLWSFSESSLNYLEIESLSGKPHIDSISFPSQIRKEMTGFEAFAHLENSNYLIGSSKGYLVFNLREFDHQDFQIRLTKIQRAYPNGSDHISLTDGAEFKNSLEGISFNYSALVFGDYHQPEYQYRLLGLYNNWSKWSKESSEDFKNLPFGDYTFEVRGRVGYQLSSNVARFEFSIAKPWYLSNLMLLLYVLAVIVFSLFMHQVYKRYYNRQKKKLIEHNQKELALKALENEQELMKLKNEKLQQDIESKNRELAISTMSLIKKNEFLSDIKEKLKEKESDRKMKNVITIIDKNLNNNDDWKFFEEAFNNADKDFLKKVKDKHPNLTSNDLRLCAYLRLNLSSKEIAPLLNISPRSVEVKRYRLRKKMDLPHEENLTSYILSL